LEVSQNWYSASMTETRRKELVWVASSLRDLRAFPEQVREVMGYALFLAYMRNATLRRKEDEVERS
jgi:phage-related protein